MIFCLMSIKLFLQVALSRKFCQIDLSISKLILLLICSLFKVFIVLLQVKVLKEEELF